MFEQVLKQIQTIIIGANFLSLNANEVITIDDQFWILVHAYVMHAWKRILISRTFQHVVEGANANNLIVIIAQAFMKQGGLIQEETTKKLICFGFQGLPFSKVTTME
jgi:hypothetical protein